MPSSSTALQQSTAEVMACAICDLFPHALLVDCAATDYGFHYDLIIPQQIDTHIFPLIEERMRSIIKENRPFKVLEMMRENAATFMEHHGQEIKAQLVADLPENIVKVLQMGEFIDTCPDVLLSSTHDIGAFKLLELTSATSYSDHLGKLEISRLSGTAFPDNYSLKRFLKQYEKAKKSDHAKIGEEMKLFKLIHETKSFMWLPKGSLLCHLLSRKPRQEMEMTGFIPISQPPLLLEDLSGNTQELSLEIDGEQYAIPPHPDLVAGMIFQASAGLTELQLPMRYYTNAAIINTSPASRLHGLFSPRADTMDLEYIFCTQEQLSKELISSLQFIEKCIKIFGFEYRWHLNTKLEAGINKRLWNSNAELLEAALKTCSLDYTLDKQGISLYGPSVEVGLADALGRLWRGPFIKIDMVHPAQLKLEYQTQDGKMHQPTMVARSTLGHLSCLVAATVEHYVGMLPLQLAPEQIRVIPVSPQNAGYAASILARIESEGFRGSADYRPAALGEKIHAAERERIPYSIVVGEREEKNCLITVRSCNKTDMHKGITIDSFLARLQDTQKDRNLG
jgi:threonyl-tRNA synthetase